MLLSTFAIVTAVTYGSPGRASGRRIRNFVLVQGARVSNANAENAMSQVLSGQWKFRPPVMNGPCVILVGAKDAAPAFHMSLCCHVPNTS